ncbi:putative inner membrane transporter YedA [compost metagenome]
MNPSRPPFLPLLLALLTVYVVWGSTYLAIRVAVLGMPPFLMAGMRFLIASVLLIGIGAILRQPWPSRREIAWAGLVGLFLLLGGNGLVVWAEQFIPSSLAALLIASMPLWSLAFEAAVPTGDRPSALGVAGIGLGFLGVITLFWPTLKAGDSSSLLAQALVILGTMTWALGTMIARRVSLPRSGVFNSGFTMLSAGFAFILVSLGFGEPFRVDWAAIPMDAWLALAYLIVFGSCIAFSAFAWLNRHAPPGLTTTYAYVNPVVAIILGYFLLQEPVTAWTMAGSALIVLSVGLVIGGGKQKEPRYTLPTHPDHSPQA